MTRRIPLSKIRNIGIVAHVDAGKTTVTEKVLLRSGVIHAAGTVHHGDTHMDTHAISRKKGITIVAAAATVPWGDHEIHLIDTPGHVDFAVEVERSLRVLDGAVVVLDAVAGVEPQTESVWRRASKRRLPRIVFVNKLDRAGADFAACVDEVRTRLGAIPAVVTLPWVERVERNERDDGDDAVLLGVLDVVTRRALRFKSGVDDIGEAVSSRPRDGVFAQRKLLPRGTAGYTVEPLGVAQIAAVEEARAALLTELANVDERVLEVVVNESAAPGQQSLLRNDAIPGAGGHGFADAVHADVSDALIVDALRAATCAGVLVPVLCGAAYKDVGVEPLLDAVCAYLPAPAGDDARPLVATAFKVVHDAFGATTFVRVVDGVLEKGAAVVSARTNKKIRVGRIVQLFADKREDVDAARAGDIAGLTGLALSTGDTLVTTDSAARPSFMAALAASGVLESFAFDPPVLALAIEPKAKSDRDALGTALGRLLSEDPSLVVRTDEETGETTLAGMGELHLEVAIEKLRTDHKVDVVTGKPRVAYKETPTAPVVHSLTWKKQGGGPGQYARVTLRVGPAEQRGAGFTFTDETKGGSVPKEFVPAVHDGVKNALARGGAHGFPIVDVAVALLDGDAHSVDSSELSFSLCAAACFSEAVASAQAAARVLEPVMSVDVTVPDARVGDVTGDLLRRRGSIVGVDGGDDGDSADRVVHALVPLAEMFGYASDLRSRTQGRGTFSMALARLDFVPHNVAATLHAT